MPNIHLKITATTVATMLCCCAVALGFPPAPHHTLHGTVRDQSGDPLATGEATIILSGPAGEVIRGPVDSSIAPGINYTLRVPQDANVTSKLYAPTAMLPMSPFTIRVVIGNTSYLPIEMLGQVRTLGAAAGTTRLDLTLGEDSDLDGLPDAWERDLIDFDPDDKLNGLSDVNPDDDSDGDGMKNLSEYLAGTYAFDRLNGLKLEIMKEADDVAGLEFVTVIGRTYHLTASEDGVTWEIHPFSLSPTGEDPVFYYQAKKVTVVKVYVPSEAKPNTLFRLHVE